MRTKADLLLVLVGALVGVATDFHAFLLAKKANPDVSFDWRLSVGRAIAGALVGSGAAVLG